MEYKEYKIKRDKRIIELANSGYSIGEIRHLFAIEDSLVRIITKGRVKEVSTRKSDKHNIIVL